MTEDFYNFSLADQKARKIDSRETFTVQMKFPGPAMRQRLAVLGMPWSVWRKMRRRCPVCRARRPKWQGNHDWLKHISKCAGEKAKSDA